MTAMVLCVRAPLAELQRPAAWARTRVRLVESERPGWCLADVGQPNQAALERVAEEVSSVGPALLVVVGDLRTGVQLWSGGRRAARVGWASAEVASLAPDEAWRVAAQCASALQVDPAPVARVLREANSPDRALRALLTALSAPAVTLGRHPRGPLDSERATELPRRGLLEATVEETWGH